MIDLQVITPEIEVDGQEMLIEVAGQLRAARHRAGLSQTELATRAGVAQKLVSDVERGNNSVFAHYVTLAHALNMSFAGLVAQASFAMLTRRAV